MSRLTIYREDFPEAPTLTTEDPDTIQGLLAIHGIRFERWSFPEQVSPEDESDHILAVFRPHLDALMGAGGAGSADVMRMNGPTDTYPAIRRKFIEEHTHSEDEVRFFVHGAGTFTLHMQGQVFSAYCTAGDLISVPAGIPH